MRARIAAAWAWVWARRWRALAILVLVGVLVGLGVFGVPRATRYVNGVRADLRSVAVAVGDAEAARDDRDCRRISPRLRPRARGARLSRRRGQIRLAR